MTDENEHIEALKKFAENPEVQGFINDVNEYANKGITNKAMIAALFSLIVATKECYADQKITEVQLRQFIMQALYHVSFSTSFETVQKLLVASSETKDFEDEKTGFKATAMAVDTEELAKRTVAILTDYAVLSAKHHAQFQDMMETLGLNKFDVDGHGQPKV